mgnify:CR=1 FL=1
MSQLSYSVLPVKMIPAFLPLFDFTVLCPSIVLAERNNLSPFELLDFQICQSAVISSAPSLAGFGSTLRGGFHMIFLSTGAINVLDKTTMKSNRYYLKMSHRRPRRVGQLTLRVPTSTRGDPR